MYTALTIAGSDSSGGAGIQADIKTMTANRVYAMSAITALTAQNTTGVTDIMEVTPKFLAEQLDSIFTDINPDAIKTGMVSSSELIETIADKLTEYHAKNIVVDPVMVATSGARLISEEAIGTLKSKLLPLATVITPNIPEAEVLSEMEIKTEADMEKAAETAGADYLGSGAVFGTSTKTDAKPMELDLFQEICESVTIPVVAIGGINADNVLRLKGRKMAGAEVVSGIFACEDIEKGTRELLEKVASII